MRAASGGREGDGTLAHVGEGLTVIPKIGASKIVTGWQTSLLHPPELVTSRQAS
jgi:hypothetical protein